MTNNELVKAVKQYALDHYNDGGWDFVVECWSDDEISEEIGSCFQGEHSWCYFPPKHADDIHSDGTAVSMRTVDGYPR